MFLSSTENYGAKLQEITASNVPRGKRDNIICISILIWIHGYIHLFEAVILGWIVCRQQSRLLQSADDCFLALQWWNDLPIDITTAETLHIFCHRLKIHLFRLHHGSFKKKKKYFSISYCFKILHIKQFSLFHVSSWLWIKESFKYSCMDTYTAYKCIYTLGNTQLKRVSDYQSKMCHEGKSLLSNWLKFIYSIFWKRAL